jgi:hypothetical protein
MCGQPIAVSLGSFELRSDLSAMNGVVIHFQREFRFSHAFGPLDSGFSAIVSDSAPFSKSRISPTITANPDVN